MNPRECEEDTKIDRRTRHLFCTHNERGAAREEMRAGLASEGSARVGIRAANLLLLKNASRLPLKETKP